MTTKIALLGAGAIADSHLQAYLKWPDRCCLTAIADLFPDKAREKAARHNLTLPVFNDVEDLIRGADFDAASICLPPFEHAPAALALLRAGKHVLVEKPMAPSLEECDAMIAAAESGDRVLSVVAQNRFKTPMKRLKEVVDSGLLGRILHAQVDSFWWRGGNYYDLWWRGTWDKEGGGCTMNHAVHHIDLFQWMRGMPSTLRALTTNLAHQNSEVEDFATAVLSYPDGTLGQITASLVHHGEEQQIVFQGERAKAAVPWQLHATRQRENGFPEQAPEVRDEIQRFYDALPPVNPEGHDGQILNFLEAIAGREPLVVDGREGRRTLELITAIYQSGLEDRPVTLPLPPTAPFYTRDGILRHARRYHRKSHSVQNFGDNSITLGRDYGR